MSVPVWFVDAAQGRAAREGLDEYERVLSCEPSQMKMHVVSGKPVVLDHWPLFTSGGDGQGSATFVKIAYSVGSDG